MIFILTYLSLIGLHGYWHLFWHPDPLWLKVVILLPLLLPLPWLLRQSSHQTRVICCYISFPYFIHGMTEVVANPANRMLALTEVGLCLLLFITLIRQNVLSRRSD